MAEVTITFNPATLQVYVNPPLVSLSPDDQTILFTLNGGGVFQWNTQDGQRPITFVTKDDAGHGYSDWPPGATLTPMSDGVTWLLDLNEPLSADSPTFYYKWMFHLVNNEGTWFIDDDPDIGNDPPSG